MSPSSAYNLIGTGGSGGLIDGNNGNQVGIANPGLGRLADNGGPTPTIALLAGSPAIDTGSNALAVDPTTGLPLATDQRGTGFPRIVGGTVDIGAFERPIVTNPPTIYLVTNSSGDPSVVGSLPYVINEANANTDLAGSVIQFDPTVFATPQTITLAGTLELSEPSGPEVIDGPGANLVTVSGNNAVRVFQVDTGVVASLAGLTISGGSVIGDYGGGIEVEKAGTLTLADSTVSGNSATDVGINFSGIGGGIANAGWLTVTGSTFTNNSAHYVGGGIYNVGTLTVGGNSTFTNNSAYSGGGIENEADAGVTTVANSTFSNNSADPSGGSIANSGTLTIEAGTRITNSSATSNAVPNGGGIINSGTLTAVGLTVAGNSGNWDGGGIANSGTMTLADSTVADNSTSSPLRRRDLQHRQPDGHQLHHREQLRGRRWWGDLQLRHADGRQHDHRLQLVPHQYLMERSLAAG